MDCQLFRPKSPLDLFESQPMSRVFVVEPCGKFTLILDVVDMPQMEKVSRHIVLLSSDRKSVV